MKPAFRLPLAIALSILLHLALIAGQLVTPAPEKPIRLNVRLVVPAPAPEEGTSTITPPEPDILNKNTIATGTDTAAVQPNTLRANKQGRLKAPQENQALRRISAYVVYPPTAVEAGLEGTTHLLIKLDANGTILHASVAATSGHPELDHAAVNAALRAGRIESGGRSEILIPMTFRLQ